MLVALFLGLVRADDVSERFISTETARLYTFNCTDSLKILHVSFDLLSLLIRVSDKGIKCEARNLTNPDDGPKSLNPSFEPQGSGDEQYFEAKVDKIGDNNQPFELVFSCQQETGTRAVSLLVEQSVISRGWIITLGIISIAFVAVTLGIIGFQFATFHRKKND
jgi:hypothetical protein